MATDARATQQLTSGKMAVATEIMHMLASLVMPGAFGLYVAYIAFSSGQLASGVFWVLFVPAFLLMVLRNPLREPVLPAQGAMAATKRLLWDGVAVAAVPASLATPMLGLFGGDAQFDPMPFFVANLILRAPTPFLQRSKAKAAEPVESRPAMIWTWRGRIEAGLFAASLTILIARGLAALNQSTGLLNAFWIVLAVFVIGSPFLLMGWSNDQKKRDSNTRKL